MTENVDTLVLKRLRPIHADIGVIEERLGDVEDRVDGLTGVAIATGRYPHDIDGRVERLEAKIGG